jgi:hypothetical protein
MSAKAEDEIAEKKKRESFRTLWADLKPKMRRKCASIDEAAEDLFMLGWAIGIQAGMEIGVAEANHMVRQMQTGALE